MRIMEFATEEEMREILGDDVKGFDIKSSWATRDFEEEPTVQIPVADNQKWYIFAFVNGGKLFISKSGTTYQQCNAKSFSTVAANNKVAAMNRVGTYKWQKMRKA